MVLFTLLSVALLLRLMHRFSWTVWAGCAASGAVAAGFHLFAVNVLVAQILVVAFEFLRPSIRERSSTGRLTAIALAPLTALVLVVGGLLPMLSHDPANGVRFPFQKAFPAALLSFLGDHRYGTRLDVLSITLLGLAIVGWFALRGHPLLRRLISLLLLSPAALYGFSSVAPVFTLHPRFFTYLLPFVFLLVAAGLRSMVSVTDAIRPRSALLDVAARGIAVVIVGLTAIALVGRAHVPQKDPWAKARIAVAAFVDAHPDALFPTNDPGFVRVRLRQQPNMHRVPTAPSVKTIRARLAEHPTDPVYYIYVRQKRFTESDLIHFKGDTPPDVLSQRDRWLRGFLDRNAELELDIPPRVRIYRLRP
jgi:hypothetical protein